MNARDRVKLCIEQARSHSGETALGSVINAVEILAGELKAVPESAQTFIGALDMLSTTPQPNFVERLAEVAFRAPPPDMTNFDAEEWAHVADTHKTLLRAQVTAILAELAKMPADLPTKEQVRIASYDIGNADGVMTLDAAGQRVARLFRDRFAPIVAAKDNRIQELETLHAGSMCSLRKQFEFTPQDGDANTRKWVLRADVLNAIDAQVSAATVVAGEYLEMIDVQQKRIAEFEAQIAGLERDRRHCVDAISESNLVPPGRTLLEGIGELIRLHRHAKKRIAEFEARVAAVTRQRDDEHGLSNLRSYEIDTWKKELADARAKIAERETNHSAAVEALDKLASYWEKSAVYEGMPEEYRRGLKDCAKELREGIAKLEAEPPSDATTPKFFATENELRGSYFCTGFPFRPHLRVGRDIEFDDIPRLLKLGRNDGIEIRVVQRAKQ